MARFRRIGIMSASLGCLALVGAALLPREARTASDIDDLRTGLNVYQGQLYSNTNGTIQGVAFNIQITSKTGNKFVGNSSFGEVAGSVSSSGKFKAEVEATPPAAARGDIGVLGSFSTMKIKGQLSATGEAIVGTYDGKGAINDKGTCFFIVEFDP